MDIANLQPKFLFGLRTDIKSNVCHITEDDVLYPVGAVLVLHNFSTNRQKYLRLPDKGLNITMICVSPNKRVIAVAEKSDAPAIYLYDSQSLKRKRTINLPTERGITSKDIECMAFTNDFKSLLVVYGEPDWILVSYKYDRGKIESTTRANNLNNTGIVRQIACNPNDSSVVVLVGDVLFRMLAVNENIWRQYGYSKAESLYLRSAAWISQERIIAGTADGKIMMIENGEFKMMFKVEETILVNFQMREDAALPSSTQLLTAGITESVGDEVCCLQAFPKGFFCECGVGKVYLFEKETPHRYKKRNIFKLEEEPINFSPSNKIHSMSLSPTQDFLVVSSAIPQLFFSYLWGPDYTRQPEIKFNELGASLHRGGVGDIAVCMWKPILLTTGKEDKTIRVWNYETSELILMKQYQEDIYGVSLHPTGLYALVGFAGKLKFLTLLIDDFAVTREFTIRYCAVCRFSKQGHLFAAVNGNVIQIYSSITFENVLNLKGHNGRVTDISWLTTDHRMFSCGTDCALYEWDMQSGKRVVEVIIKTCQFTGCNIASDGRNAYAVGSDGEIKEILNGTVRLQCEIDAGGLDCIELSNSDMMMFVSGKEGSIFSVKLPLTGKKEDMNESIIHNKNVFQLKISFDDKFLISCSADGSLCIWKLVNVLGRAIKIDKDYEPSVDILIPYKDLEEKLQNIKDLNLRMTELDREHAYQIRQIEQTHDEKMKEIHEAYKEVIETLKDKNAGLENEHITEIHNINIDISRMKRNHDMAIGNLEAKYNEKLIFEYNKYSELEDKLNKVREGYDMQITQLKDESKMKVMDVTDNFQEEITKREAQIAELQLEARQLEKDHEIIKQQIEDDADREIYELKASHEAELRDEQNINIRLRAENGIFQKKLNSTVKEIEELKHTIFQLENDHIKFKNIINGLEKDIQELKKEITERDETIQGKEKKIYDLKKKTQELEKYKFVLDFQITELKAEIEPRERKIHDQDEEIQEMIVELENLQKNITQLELQLAELQEKLSASHHEFKREQNKFRQAQDVIKQMRTDLHYASGLIQEPNKLKTVIKDMFHKYNADKEFIITRQEDCESKNEFSKQRQYLEQSIAGLKRTVSKRFDKNEDKLKIMEESTQLISEVNILRNQLKLEQERNRQMESVLGLTKKTLQPREAQKRLAEAVKTREEIRREYLDEIQTNETCIHELKDENYRLTQKLCDRLGPDFYDFSIQLNDN